MPKRQVGEKSMITTRVEQIIRQQTDESEWLWSAGCGEAKTDAESLFARQGTLRCGIFYSIFKIGANL